MQEEKYDLNGESGMKFEKGRFGKWFENFWYHYKWHTIFAAFILLVVTVCTVQMCQKEEYDTHIIYAGSENVSRMRENGDLSEYEILYRSLTEAVEDFDGNGKVYSSFEAMFMLTSEEIERIEAELEEKKNNGEEAEELNYSQLTENNKAFGERIQYSDVYVFLISEPLYHKYQREATDESSALFVPIRELADGNADIQFLDDSAVYLHSTEFGKLPGLSELPEDTLITLRAVGALSTMLDKEESNEDYERAKRVVANMLNYGS